MKENVIEKYYEYRIKNLVKYVTILLEKTFGEKFKWNKQISQCAEFYFKNYVLINGYNSKLIIKYRRFFDKNNVNERSKQIIFISIFETIIDFKDIKNPDQEKVIMMIAKCFNLAVRLDELINLTTTNLTLKNIYDSIEQEIKDDEKFYVIFNKSKKQLQTISRKNISLKKKFVKLLEDSNFQIEFTPLIAFSNEKPAYEVITKYSIKELSKYTAKEVEYVIFKEDIDIQLVYITYSLVCTMLIKMLEKKKNAYYMIVLDNKFFKKKTYLNELVKLISKHGYNNQIILEFDSINLKKPTNVKSIEKIRELGILISVYNPTLETDQRNIDFINIKNDEKKKKDFFKKYSKNGKVLIISDNIDDEYKRLVSYQKGSKKKSLNELLE